MSGFNGGFDKVKLTDVPSVIGATVGVKPTLDGQYDLNLLATERVQVRLDPNNAPKATVEQFALAMARSKFAPVIVTSDGYPVDGNTRIAAHRKRNERFVEAYVIPIAFETATKAEKDRLFLLGALLNRQHGLPLEDAEVRKAVVTALDLGLSESQITGSLGYPAKKVKAITEERKAEVKLTSLGLPTDLLKGAPLRMVSKLPPKLDDDIARDVLTLTADSGMGANELRALAIGAVECGSKELAQERVAREYVARKQQIADYANHGTGTMPSRQLSRYLSWIVKRDVSELLESNTERQQEYAERLREGISLLQRTLNTQEAKFAEKVAS